MYRVSWRKQRKITPTTALSHLHYHNTRWIKINILKKQKYLPKETWSFPSQTSFLWLKTARRTETTSVWLVKCFKPNMPFNCCRQIIIAVPPMKPVIVECDKKSTKIPSLDEKYRINKKKIMKLNTAKCKRLPPVYITDLRKPKAVWKIPVKKVAVKTKWRYNVGSSVGDTLAPIVSAISNEHAAAVPTARCFELPNMA